MGPLDGLSVFTALTENTESPRKEMLLNIDPCSGFGDCSGPRDAAYHLQGCVGKFCGDWKFHDTASATGWTPPPGAYVCGDGGFGSSSCAAPSTFTGEGSPKAYIATADDEGEQLFDLQTDPGEENNLAAKYPAVVAELKARIAAIEEGADFVPPCNVPGGSCSGQDDAGWANFAEHECWLPWVSDAVA